LRVRNSTLVRPPNAVPSGTKLSVRWEASGQGFPKVAGTQRSSSCSTVRRGGGTGRSSFKFCCPQAPAREGGRRGPVSVHRGEGDRHPLSGQGQVASRAPGRDTLSVRGENSSRFPPGSKFYDFFRNLFPGSPAAASAKRWVGAEPQAARGDAELP